MPVLHLLSMTMRPQKIGARGGTELDHRARIGRVGRYIVEHLDEPLDLQTLARVACFSPFHFHRVFAAWMGETLGDYLRRMRLERAALRLRSSRDTVTEIALAAGYETPSAFSKAFRQLFGVSPGAARRRAPPPSPALARQPRRRKMKPEIRTLADRRVLYARKTGMVGGNFNQAAKEAFATLCRFADEEKLWGRTAECVGICPDDPSTTPHEQCRYDAGLVLREGADVKLRDGVAIQTLPGGRFAVFLLPGPL